VIHTISECQIVATASYLERYVEIFGLDGAVSAYQTGVTAYNDGQRNNVYVAKWGNAYQDVRSGNHHCKLLESQAPKHP